MSSGKLRGSEARATTVVLVHDGFLGPFGSDVTTELEDRGIATMVVDLPRMGDPDEGRLGDLYADARKVHRVLDWLWRPVLLCGVLLRSIRCLTTIRASRPQRRWGPPAGGDRQRHE